MDALFVLSSLSRGGTEKKVLTVADRLNRHGYRTAVVYLGKPDLLLSEVPASVQTTDLGRRGKFSLGALSKLVSVLRDRRPVTVFCAQLYCLIYASMACRLAPLPGRRQIALVNTTTFVRARDEAFMHLYAPLLRRMDEVVFGCRSQQEAWCARYRIQRRTTGVIYNGVDAFHFAPCVSLSDRNAHRRAFGLSESSIVIGTVGRLAPEKNQRAILDVSARLIAHLPDVEVLLVGDGPERPALEARAARLSIAHRVRFTGSLSDVRPALHCMDTFVLASTSVETFSNATLEAMATGCPSVISDIGGAAELIRDGVDGLIVRAGDSEAMYQALRRLASDAGDRARISHAARSRIMGSFSVDAMVDEYLRRMAPVGSRFAG